MQATHYTDALFADIKLFLVCWAPFYIVQFVLVKVMRVGVKVMRVGVTK